MKKILLSTLVGLSLLSCKNEKTEEGLVNENKKEENAAELDLTLPEGADYALVAGEVTNLEVPVDSVEIMSPQREYVKRIKMNPDGTFSDTLKVANDGLYQFKVGNEYGRIFIKNGEAIGFRSDYPDFDNTLKFEGKGENVDKSNFVIALLLMQNEAVKDEDFLLSEEDFDKKIETMKSDYNTLIEEYKNLDQEFVDQRKAEYEQGLVGLKKYYERKKNLANKYTGKPAPSFSGENLSGDKITLEDFKGKYIYVDVWATWCGPCKAEIPALKELEEEYKNKNIAFVSLSIDEPGDKETWKAFVKDKELKGVQIFDGAAWKSNFVKDMEIQGIPRFIIIDPDGKIVDPDAPRPSSDVIKDKFEKLEL